MAKNTRIFIIEDDPIMAECIERSIRQASERYEVQIFPNAILAMAAINEALPDLIILDILLDGPDGFTFLNELISYSDTARIPIIVASSLDLSRRDLTSYGVTATLCKDTMTPNDVTTAVRRALLQGEQDA